MLEKTNYHEYEPSDENNRYQKKSYEDKYENRGNKCIDDKAEVEIDNFKTCFFLECWEFIFLKEVIEDDENETESTSREEIPCEMKYSE